MAATSYRDYEEEAKDMVEKLLTSTLERVKKEKKSLWPLISQYSNEGAEEAIEKFVKVRVSDKQ